MRFLPRDLAGPALAGLALTAVTVAPAYAGDAPAPVEPHMTLTAGVVPDPGRVQRGQVIRPRPDVLPVEGYRLTGRYGANSGLWSSSHTGLDFAVAQGSAIRAIRDATVVSAGYDGSYGLKTVLRTDDGTELWFCHQDAVAVTVGERVASGQEIGSVGMTGNTTGPHLHLEVRPGGGEPVDPEAALAEWGLQP